MHAQSRRADSITPHQADQLRRQVNAPDVSPPEPADLSEPLHHRSKAIRCQSLAALPLGAFSELGYHRHAQQQKLASRLSTRPVEFFRMRTFSCPNYTVLRVVNCILDSLDTCSSNLHSDNVFGRIPVRFSRRAAMTSRHRHECWVHDTDKLPDWFLGATKVTANTPSRQRAAPSTHSSKKLFPHSSMSIPSTCSTPTAEFMNQTSPSRA